MATKKETKDASTKTTKVFHERDYLGIIHTVHDEVLGDVSFGDLTLEEGTMLNEANGTIQERAIQMVYMMRQKAEPNLTLEEIKKLPLVKASRLIDILSKESGFLEQPSLSAPKENALEKKSKNGLQAVASPKP